MRSLVQRLFVAFAALILVLSGVMGASASVSAAPAKRDASNTQSAASQRLLGEQLEGVMQGKLNRAGQTGNSAGNRATTSKSRAASSESLPDVAPEGTSPDGPSNAQVRAASAPKELVDASLAFDASTIDLTVNFNHPIDPVTDPRFTSGDYVLGIGLSFNKSYETDASLIVARDENGDVVSFGLNKWDGYCPVEMSVSGQSVTLSANASCFYRPGTIAFSVIFGDLDAALETENWNNVDVTPASGISPWHTRGGGYWLLGADGGVFTYGNAGFFGSTGNMRLNKPVVGMSAMPTGNGYRFVAADGGVFSFGDASFSGSTGNMRLNKPVVGMATTKSGSGYWLVASDGGIFSFGDAEFFGSMGDRHLNSPIVAMTVSASGEGYYLVAADGGVFTFGDAKFLGSAGGSKRSTPITSMALNNSADGYYLLEESGDIIPFGEAPNLGSALGMWGARATAMVSTSGGYRIADSTGGVWQYGEIYHHGDMIDENLWPTFPIIGAAELP